MTEDTARRLVEEWFVRKGGFVGKGPLGSPTNDFRVHLDARGEGRWAFEVYNTLEDGTDFMVLARGRVFANGTVRLETAKEERRRQLLEAAHRDRRASS